MAGRSDGVLEEASVSLVSKLRGANDWIDSVDLPVLSPGEWLVRSERSVHTTNLFPDVSGNLFLTNRRLILRRSAPRWKVSIPRLSTWGTLSLEFASIVTVSTCQPNSWWNAIARRGKKLVPLEVVMGGGERHGFWVSDPVGWAAQVNEASRPYRRPPSARQG